MRITSRTGVIVLVTIAAVLCLFWLLEFVAGPYSPSATHYKTRPMADLSRLLIACRSYADESNGGRFPESIEELTSDYVDVENDLLARNMKGESRPYLYFPGHTTASDSGTPLIEYPFSVNGKRLIGYTGGAIEWVK